MLDFLVSQKTVKAMAEEYWQAFGLSLCLVDADGRFAGEPGNVCRCCKYWLASENNQHISTGEKNEVDKEDKQSYPGVLKHVVAEAFRWGEPTLYDKPSGKMLWAVPIVLNAKLPRLTDKGLLAVALESGFTDQSYFTKVFRRHLKVTPGEYRARFQS